MDISRKCLWSAALLCAGQLGFVSTAHAGIVVGDDVKLTRFAGSTLNSGKYARDSADTADSFRTRGTGSGGEFKIDEVGGDAANTFKSFCLELNETIVLGATYDVSGIDDFAERGGVDSDSSLGDGKDYLSNATKWLYGAYRTSTLDTDVSGFNYNSDASLNALQDAIWWLEKEISGALSGLTDALRDWAIAQTGGNQTASGGNPFTDGATDFNTQGRGTVKVMNIVDSARNDKQSQLFYTPPGGGGSSEEPVPEPFSLAIWGGLGALGLAMGRLRRRQSAKA